MVEKELNFSNAELVKALPVTRSVCKAGKFNLKGKGAYFVYVTAF